MKWIDACLKSVQHSTIPLTTLVVDNGSTDGTVEFIQREFPWVKLYLSKQNLGFGQGNNLAMAQALQEGASHVFLLNQDAYLERDTLEILMRTADQHPEFGILSPIHANGNGTALDDYFTYFFKRSEIDAWLSAQLLKGDPVPRLIETPFINAAAWLITRACLEKVGGFDPIFFHYGEDDNYAQRVLYKGLKSGISLETVFYHDREKSSTLKPDTEKRIKQEWIILQNKLADLNNPSYRMTALKVGFERVGSLITNLFRFNAAGVRFNAGMLKRMLTQWSSIEQSRKKSASSGYAPHLESFLSMGKD